MEDITPLQQLTNEVLQSEVYLFEPRPAYRLHSIAAGPQVRPAVHINYYLKDVPDGKVFVTILDDQGNPVKKLSGTRNKGINRVSWNMRHDGARTAKLRTRPPGNPHVVEEKRFYQQWEREGWYPILSWGTYGGFRGFLASPGNYTVKLTAGEKEFTQTLEVRKDPRSEGTGIDIKEQEKLQKAIRAELNSVSDMISQIEWMRKQLYTLKDAVKTDKDSGNILKAIDGFDKNLKSVEFELVQPILKEGDSKSFRYPQKLYCKLSVLASDVSNSVDFAPNKQQIEVFNILKDDVDKQKKRFEELLKKDLAVFNTYLKENNLAGIIVPVIK